MISLGLNEKVLSKAIQLAKNGQPIYPLLKSGIKPINEVLDDNEKRRLDKHKEIKSNAPDWLSKQVTGYGGEEDIIGGVKAGGVLGSLLAFLTELGMIANDMLDERNILVAASLIIMAMAFGGIVGWKINKDIKNIDI